MNGKTAGEKYTLWKSKDPFPSIKPALLNSADIEDYVLVTGMLDPFRKSKNGETKLKPASYEVDLLGRVIYWDENAKKIEREVRDRDDKFILTHNSIAFVEVEPTFRLPDYIAARFNLKILHVHRGILLGTGPLIDPGFQGSLLIPLHNLTYNDYVFHGGEGLIWIEFTKLDWPSHQDNQPIDDAFKRRGTFAAFPERKLARKNPDDYLRRAASPHSSIRSSIPVEVNEAKKIAENARKYVRTLTVFSSASVLIAIITVGTFLLEVTSFVSDVQTQLGAQVHRVTRLEVDLDSLKRDLEQIRTVLHARKGHQVESPASESKANVRGKP